jgi:hypothetical protein
MEAAVAEAGVEVAVMLAEAEVVAMPLVLQAEAEATPDLRAVAAAAMRLPLRAEDARWGRVRQAADVSWVAGVHTAPGAGR